MGRDDALLRRAIDACPDGFVAVDRDRRIVLWNATAERLLGWSQDEVLGRPDPTIPPELEDRTDTAAAGALAGEDRGTVFLVDRIHKDGRRVTLALRSWLSLGDPDDPDGFGVFFTAPADSDLRWHERNRLAKSLARATSVGEVVQHLATSLDEVLPGVRGVLVRPKYLAGDRYVALGMTEAMAERIVYEDEDWDRAAVSRLVTRTSVTSGDTRESAVLIPVGASEDAGVLVLLGVPDIDRERFVDAGAIADEAWLALERLALVHQLEEQVEALRAAHDVVASTELHLPAAARQIVTHAAEVLGRCATALQIDLDGQPVRFADSGDVELPSAAEVSEALRRQSGTGPVEVALKPGPGTAVVVPLGGPIFGGLIVVPVDGHPLSHRELRLIGSIADDAGEAIQRARRYTVRQGEVEQLRTAERTRTEFIEALVHDLKTPTTVLIGFLETIRRPGISDGAADLDVYLDAMDRQARRLLSMIEELLEAARDDRQLLQIRPERLPLGNAVDGVVRQLDPVIRGRIEVAVDSDLVASADHELIRRVLENLVSNAIKYSPRGERIDVTAAAVGSDHVALTVADQGPGIAAEEREQIFRRFAVGSAGKAAASSGLGLYVSRNIARVHGGDLTVEVADGGGAAFVLTLPRWRGERQADG